MGLSFSHKIGVMAEPLPTPQDVPAHRIHGLSDGIFAIVMTLLVLELRVPEQAGELAQAAREAHFAADLAALLPRLIVYAFTFLIAGVSWLSHTHFQSSVLRTDRRLAFLNILYLMLVSLLPFTSALIGEHGDTALGVAVYAVNQVLIAAAFLWMLAHAVSGGLMRPGWANERLGQRALVNALVFTVMALLAFAAKPLAWYTPFALILLHPLLGRVMRRPW